MVEDTPIGGTVVGTADRVFSDLQRSLRSFQVLTHREAMEALHAFCLFERPQFIWLIFQLNFENCYLWDFFGFYS